MENVDIIQDSILLSIIFLKRKNGFKESLDIYERKGVWWLLLETLFSGYLPKFDQYASYLVILCTILDSKFHGIQVALIVVTKFVTHMI